MLKRELKINIKGLIVWISIIISMYLLVFLIYPSITENANSKSLNEMLSTMPQEMLAAFNMDITGIDTVFGWFKTEGYIYLELLGGMYAAILGATILLKEENDKTIEFLASKPVSRNKIITSKVLCGIINIFLFTFVILIFNLIGFKLSDDLHLKTFLMLSIIPLLLYYMLFFITLFISTFLKKTRKSMNIGIAIVFLSYFSQIVGNMSDKAKLLKEISLFEFTSTRDIILNNNINEKYLIIGVAIIILTMVETYIRYNRKEFI